jgi:DNA-binding transcriptional MerR regulator
MKETTSDRRYSADELATLAGVPRRTLRYYIQLGLVDRPIGETRAAYYTWAHLHQLLEIRRLTEQGFSLERVQELLSSRDEPPPAAATPRAGSILVQSHVYLAPGVELVIDPGHARLTPEQLRRFAREALNTYARIARSAED